MDRVDLKEFEADVNTYLARATAGESFRITVEGRPWVDMVPAREPTDAGDTGPDGEGGDA